MKKSYRHFDQMNRILINWWVKENVSLGEVARRATTIANLARVISERDVSDGLRRTLLTQARRLERLTAQRVQELGSTVDLKKK